MLNIKVLGTGCPNCQRLEANVAEAVKTAALQADIQKVDEIPQIMKYGVMNMPALVVNENVLVSGRVATAGEIVEMLTAATS